MSWWTLLLAACTPAPEPQPPVVSPTASTGATGDTGAVTPCGPDELTGLFTVGQDSERAPLGDGQPGDIVRGIQGGWHVDVGARVESTAELVEASGTLHVRGILLGGDDAPHPLGLLRRDDCGGDVLHRLFIDPTALEPDSVCAIDGETVTVTLRVVDDGEALERVEAMTARFQGFGEEFCAYYAR